MCPWLVGLALVCVPSCVLSCPGLRFGGKSGLLQDPTLGIPTDPPNISNPGAADERTDACVPSLSLSYICRRCQRLPLPTLCFAADAWRAKKRLHYALRPRRAWPPPMLEWPPPQVRPRWCTAMVPCSTRAAKMHAARASPRATRLEFSRRQHRAVQRASGEVLIRQRRDAARRRSRRRGRSAPIPLRW